MISPERIAWVTGMALEAKDAGHIWPEMAAAEAALESGYGESLLAKEALNLFGMKQHKHPAFGTINLPTKEFDKLKDDWEVVEAAWVKYATIAECFKDRMETLRRLAPAPGYQHYAAALVAEDARSYIIEVSRKWSTDPNRSAKVLDVYNAVFASNNSYESPVEPDSDQGFNSGTDEEMDG